MCILTYAKTGNGDKRHGSIVWTVITAVVGVTSRGGGAGNFTQLGNNQATSVVT